MKDQKRNDLLKLYIICSIGGSLFDLSQFLAPTLNLDIFNNSHLFLKDLMYVGLSGLFFVQTTYNQLKLKTFGFMLVIWRVVVLIFNLSGLYCPFAIMVLYCLYAIWLLRILLINPRLETYSSSSFLKIEMSYNIFIPVHSFRGLIQAICLFWRDPRYESTALIDKNKMYYIKNKMFYREDKSFEKIEEIISNTHAKISIKHISPKQKKAVDRLLYTRAYTGFKDCNMLKIKGLL